MGDKESLCLTPLRCLILDPGSLFKRKEEEDVAQSAAIQFFHLIPKLRNVMISKR
jgi:hypothetical protein